jgi:hypothetical protein
MNTKLFFATVVVIACSHLLGQNVPALFERPGGLVADEQTAVKIAEAILFPIYGEKIIRNQRPYRTTLRDGKWTIDGTYLPPGFTGGTFHIVILQRDARVIEIGHGA